MQNTYRIYPKGKLSDKQVKSAINVSFYNPK